VPYLSTGWAWYLITLLPVIGLIQVGAQAYADRYAYVPLIGLFLAAVWGAAFRCKGRAVPWLSAVALAAVALFTLASARELPHWRDSVSLFRRATEVSPGSHVAQTNLATALVDEGRLAEGLTHFRAAVEVTPGLASARMNLANVLALSGALEEALVQYEEASRLDARDPRIPYNFGQALLDAGRPERAAEQLREALRLDPGYVEARRTLADLLARQGRQEEAERLLREGANR
jgi:tetratricopeptide (TPR) repeat protein